ncbi:unnamed protein product [Rhizophagus irregularis]|nr:unnamed protein product [Rhizophagus irregularis]CAB4429403.1 unnamed protein product [Rhizophagus irregularis]
MPITEDAVVDTINRFRKGIDDEVKEDNKKWKEKEEKFPYQRFELSPLFSEENEAVSSKERRSLKLEYVIPKVA